MEIPELIALLQTKIKSKSEQIAQQEKDLEIDKIDFGNKMKQLEQLLKDHDGNE